MKNYIALFLALIMCLFLAACGGNENPVTEQNTENAPSIQGTDSTDNKDSDENSKISVDDFPFEGMWKSSADDVTHMRIKEGGELSFEAILTSTTTHTVNGVSSTTTTQSLSNIPGVWSIQGDVFILNNKGSFELVYDGTDYKLVGEKVTYVRIGEVDYELVIDKGEDGAGETEPIPYQMGETVIAEGVELTFPEVGFSNDIRYTSKSSGISITSGPNPEADKQFFYLKGTLKNTGKQTVRPAIGGKVTLDGYEYDLRVDLIHEDGTPCSSVEPLDRVIIYIYAHIPVELAESFESGEMIFGFNDNFENVDIKNCDYLYSVDAKK